MNTTHTLHLPSSAMYRVMEQDNEQIDTAGELLDMFRTAGRLRMRGYAVKVSRFQGRIAVVSSQGGAA